MSDLPTTIHNERTKLTATYLNGSAIAFAAIGGIANVMSYLSDAAPAMSALAVVLTTLACFGVSAGLHFAARALLGSMKQ